MVVVTSPEMSEVNVRPTGITKNTEEVVQAMSNPGIIAYEYVQNVLDYQLRSKGPAKIYFQMKNGDLVSIVDIPTIPNFSKTNIASIILVNDIGKSGLHPDNLVTLESNQVEEDYTLGQHGRGGKIAAAAILGWRLAKGIKYGSYHPDIGRWEGQFEMTKYGSDARTETLNLSYQKSPQETSETTQIEIVEPSTVIIDSFINLTTNFLPLNPTYENCQVVGKVRKYLNQFTLKFKKDDHINGELNEWAGDLFGLPKNGTYTESPRVEILPDNISLESEIDYFSKIKVYTQAFVDGLKVTLYSTDKSVLPWSFFGLGRASYNYRVLRSSDSSTLRGNPEYAAREALVKCGNPVVFQSLIDSLLKSNSTFRCVENTAISSIMGDNRELTKEAQSAFAEGWKLYLQSKGLPEATLISFSSLATEIATGLDKKVIEIDNHTFGYFLKRYAGVFSADNLYKEKVDETTRIKQEEFKELERKALKFQTDENIYLKRPKDFGNYLRGLENILKLCAESKGGYMDRNGGDTILIEVDENTSYSKYQFLPKDIVFLAENICALSPKFQITISLNQGSKEAVKYVISAETSAANSEEIKINIQKAVAERVDEGFAVVELRIVGVPSDTEIKVINLLKSSFTPIQNEDGFVDRKKWFASRDPADPRLPDSMIDEFARLMAQNQALAKQLSKAIGKEPKEKEDYQGNEIAERAHFNIREFIRRARYPLAAVIAAGMLYFPVSKALESLDILGKLNALPPIPGLSIQPKQGNNSSSWGSFTSQTYSDYPGPALEQQQQTLDAQKQITNEVTIVVQPDLKIDEITKQQDEVLRLMDKTWVLEVYGNADGNGYYAEYVSDEITGDWKINTNVESILNLPDRIDARDKIVISKRFKLNPVITNQFKLPIKNNTKIAAIDISSEVGKFEGYKVEMLTDGTVLVTIPPSLTSDVGFIDVKATLIPDPNGQVKPYDFFKSKVDRSKLSDPVTSIISQAVGLSNTQGIDYYVALKTIAQQSAEYSFKPNYPTVLPMSDSPEDSLNKYFKDIKLGTCGIANRELMYLSSITPEGVKLRKVNFVFGWLIGVDNNPASKVDTGMLSGDSYHGYTIMQNPDTEEVLINDATPTVTEPETKAFFEQKSDYEKSQIVKKVYEDTKQLIQKNSSQAVDYWRYLKEAGINIALIAITFTVAKLTGKKRRVIEE